MVLNDFISSRKKDMEYFNTRDDCLWRRSESSLRPLLQLSLKTASSLVIQPAMFNTNAISPGCHW